jgi:hypothetical protein
VLAVPKEIVVFRANNGHAPFEVWLDDLNDKRAVARVLARGWHGCGREISAIANRSAKACPNCAWITGRVTGFILDSKGGCSSCCFAAETSGRKTATSDWRNNIGANSKKANHENQKL